MVPVMVVFLPASALKEAASGDLQGLMRTPAAAMSSGR